MSLRDRQKAKRKAEDEEERLFFEQTGLKDKSKDFTMDNLIKKYQHDMERHEKKFAKMKELEKTGKNYDLEDIVLSDDEKEGDFIERMAEERIKEKKNYDDEPYKAVEEERQNVQKQYEDIQQKLEMLKGKVDDGEKLSTESDHFKQYEKILNEMDEMQDIGFRLDHREEADQLRSEDLKEFDRLYQQESTIRDSLYSKQVQRGKLKKQGGAKSESPVWKDED